MKIYIHRKNRYTNDDIRYNVFGSAESLSERIHFCIYIDDDMECRYCTLQHMRFVDESILKILTRQNARNNVKRHTNNTRVVNTSIRVYFVLCSDRKRLWNFVREKKRQPIAIIIIVFIFILSLKSCQFK